MSDQAENFTLPLYELEPPDDYPWGLEEVAGFLAGFVGGGIVLVRWAKRRYGL